MKAKLALDPHLAGRIATVAALGFLPARSQALPLRAVAEDERSVVAFVNARVVTMEDELVREGCTVLVEGADITRVGPAETVVVPDHARVVDASGCYLVPGLADMHVHVRSREELVSYLAYGVTTILQLSGGNEVRDLLALREQLERGEVVGPTLYLSGPLIDGERPIFPAVSVAVAGPDVARRVVADQKQAGYDILKIYNGLDPDAFDAVMETSKELRIPVAGHVPEQVGIERMLESEAELFAHASCFRDEILPTAERMQELVQLAAEYDTAVVANLLVSPVRRFLTEYESIFQDPEIRFVPPHVVQIWRDSPPDVVRRYSDWVDLKADRFEEKLVKALADEGVLLLLGTDSPAAMAGLFPGKSAITELEDLVRAGLTRFEALSCATRNAGTFVASRVRPGVRFGKVADGYRADLVLLDRNPLEDLAAYSDPVGTCVRGRWFSREELAAVREAIATSFDR